MGTIIGIVLVAAYAWSVWNLARIGWSPRFGPLDATAPDSHLVHIDLVAAHHEPAGSGSADPAPDALRRRMS